MLRIVIAFLYIFFITGKIYNDSAVLIIFMSDSELNGSVSGRGCHRVIYLPKRRIVEGGDRVIVEHDTAIKNGLSHLTHKTW